MVVELARVQPPPFLDQVVQPRHRLRHEVARCAHEPRTADGENGIAEQLDPRVYEEVPAHAVEQAVDVLEVLVRLLDADEIVVGLLQPRHGIDLDVHGRAPRDVVQDDRQVHAFGQRVEMAENPFLSRPAVVRRDEQQRVGPVGLGEAGELDGLLVVGGCAARYEGHPAVHRRGRGADHFLTFFERQRTRFAGRPLHRHAMGPASDLPFDQGGQAVQVQRPVPEGCNYRNDRPAHRSSLFSGPRHNTRRFSVRAALQAPRPAYRGNVLRRTWQCPRAAFS